jgi:hypothetical protein
MRYPCPCCGYLVFDEQGSYAICPVCGWEDNVHQLRWPHSSIGPNGPLYESQLDYDRLERSGREAYHSYPLDAGWRPIDPERDDFEPTGVCEADWPDDSRVLYYWRPTFWRRKDGDT